MRFLGLCFTLVLVIGLATACGGNTPSSAEQTGSMDVVGTYVKKDSDGRDYLEIKDDGQFYLTENGIELVGAWSRSGDTLTLRLPTGLADSVRIQGNLIIDDDEGETWVKQKGKERSSELKGPTRSPAAVTPAPVGRTHPDPAAAPTLAAPTPPPAATSRGPKAASTVPTPPPSVPAAAPQPKPIPPSATGPKFGPIMVSLASVDRGQNSATFSFVITKISSGPPPATQDPTLIIIVTDDHGNDYKQALNYLPEGSPSEFVSNLPVGFQYMISVSLRVPRAAPIAKLRIGVSSSLIDVDLSKQARLSTMKDFGNASLSPGGSLTVTRFQKFSFGAISPGLNTDGVSPDVWYIPVKIENSDYNNGLPMSVQVLSQLGDGEIFVLPSKDIEILPGSSSIGHSIRLPRILGGQPLDQTLIFFFKDETTKTQIVRFWPAKSSDFPPRVGQAAGAGESLFIHAYAGIKYYPKQGKPLGPVRWFAGGQVPKDSRDVLVQEIEGSDGTLAIVWDKQRNARSAYVMAAPFWLKYVSIGGPYAKSSESSVSLRGPNDNLRQSVAASKTPAETMEFAGGILVHLLQGPAKGHVFMVTGSILEKWRQAEAEARVGWPLSDSSEAGQSGTQGSSVTGIFQRFEQGEILLHRSGNLAGASFVVVGPTSDPYFAVGGSKSWLGYPVSDPYDGPIEGYQQLFEGGYIATGDGKTYQALKYESGLIAFVSDRDGNEEIYITDTSGRTQVNLTRNPADDRSPAWSPKGDKIAFVSVRGGGRPDIYVMDPNGSNLVRIITNGEDPDWFPDGSRIVFVRKVNGLYSLFTANADGSNARQVPAKPTSSLGSPYHTRHPSISPDGTKVVFAAGSVVKEWKGGWSPESHIYVVKIDGTDLKQLFYSNWSWADGAYPAWSSKGNQVAFIAPGYVYIMNADSTKAAPVLYVPTDSAWAPGPGKGLSWSPDGVGVVFARPVKIYYEGLNIYIAPRPVVGSKLVRPVVRGSNNWDPTWALSAERSVIQVEGSSEDRKVIFVQGIDSESLNDCNDPAKVGFLNKNGQNRVDWLANSLLSSDLVKSSVRSLDSRDDFFYFSYAHDYCKNSDKTNDYRRPKYQVIDTCNGVQSAATSLNLMVLDLLRMQPTAKFDIVAHSMGGLVVSQWLWAHPAMLGSVHSVTTLDSPLRGVPDKKIYPVGACDSSTSASWNDLWCQTYADIRKGCASVVIPGIANLASKVLFYTMDATQKDLVPFEWVPGDRTTLLKSSSRLHCMVDDDHVSIWSRLETNGDTVRCWYEFTYPADGSEISSTPDFEVKKPPYDVKAKLVACAVMNLSSEECRTRLQN